MINSRARWIYDLCKRWKTYELTVKDIDAAALIYSERKKQGRPIEDTDSLIAAQVVANGYTFVTDNTNHFEDIDGLSLENWTE